VAENKGQRVQDHFIYKTPLGDVHPQAMAQDL
jgi:hypothetical protein